MNRPRDAKDRFLPVSGRKRSASAKSTKYKRCSSSSSGSRSISSGSSRSCSSSSSSSSSRRGGSRRPASKGERCAPSGWKHRNEPALLMSDSVLERPRLRKQYNRLLQRANAEAAKNRCRRKSTQLFLDVDPFVKTRRGEGSRPILTPKMPRSVHMNTKRKRNDGTYEIQINRRPEALAMNARERHNMKRH